jgi:hypothetical protein
MKFSKFRKMVDSRRRTQGLSATSTMETMRGSDGVPYALRLTVSMFTAPSYWLTVAESCKDFASFQINGHVSGWSEQAVETQKISMVIIPLLLTED